jgi:CBS-domain-containing membrane protein
MLIRDIMTTNVQSCGAYESINAAAQRMWDADVGAVPVLDDKQRVVGMLTDRDICMAAYTQGMPLRQIIAAEVMSRILVSCDPDDTIAHAEELMRTHQVRRLPVVDRARHLLGIVSVNDIARVVAHTHRGQGQLVATMAAVSNPRTPAPMPDGERGHADRRA